MVGYRRLEGFEGRGGAVAACRHRQGEGLANTGHHLPIKGDPVPFSTARAASREAGQTAGSDLASPVPWSTNVGLVPLRFCGDGCPVNSSRLERQYRDRQASRHAREVGQQRSGGRRCPNRTGTSEWTGLRGTTRCACSTAMAETVGVAIETPRGPVVESLLALGLAVHSINPKQLDRFRDRYSPAGAKDDRRDARAGLGAAHRPALPAPGGGVRPGGRRTARVVADRRRAQARAGAADQPHGRPTVALLRGVQPRLPGVQPRRRGSRGVLGSGLWKRVPTPTAAYGVAPVIVRQAVEEVPHPAHRRGRAEDPAVAAAPRRRPAADGDPQPRQAEEQRDATILRSMPGVGRLVLGRASARRCLAEADDARRRRRLPRAPLPVRGGAGHPAVRSGSGS